MAIENVRHAVFGYAMVVATEDGKFSTEDVRLIENEFFSFLKRVESVIFLE